MRKVTYILNEKAVEWELSLGEVYIFSWLYELPSWAKKIDSDGTSYYFASRTKAIEDMPLVTDKTDTMYRYYQKLEQKGLIINIKVGGCDYIAITNKGKTWNSSIRESDLNPSKSIKNDSNSDSNPKKLGNISENHSDLNPTYSKLYNNSKLNIEKEKEKLDYDVKTKPFFWYMLYEETKTKKFTYKEKTYSLLSYQQLIKFTLPEFEEYKKTNEGFRDLEGYANFVRMANDVVYDIEQNKPVDYNIPEE